MPQPQKFIKLQDGRLVEDRIESISTTTGAPDADKLVRVGTNGKLDPTLLPVGAGADSLSFMASENLAGGDWVTLWDDAGTVKARKADAAAAGKEAVGFVIDAVAMGQMGTVFFEGTNTVASGLTPALRHYLSATTPGASTATPPAATGNVVQYLGIASSATSLAFEATDGVILA